MTNMTTGEELRTESGVSSNLTYLPLFSHARILVV